MASTTPDSAPVTKTIPAIPPLHLSRHDISAGSAAFSSQETSMTVEEMIDALIDREGGYVADPGDRGGATRFGITEAVARLQGYKGDIRNLPRAEAVAIYKRLYWLGARFDAVAAIAPRLAAELFDAGVNMGPATAITFLQRALNALNRGATDYPDIAVDGAIGAKTLATLTSFVGKRGEAGETVLVRAIDALRGARYIRLAETRPADEAFLYGWLANRIGETVDG
jgi:lysozyme family protein